MNFIFAEAGLASLSSIETIQLYALGVCIITIVSLFAPAAAIFAPGFNYRVEFATLQIFIIIIGCVYIFRELRKRSRPPFRITLCCILTYFCISFLTSLVVTGMPLLYTTQSLISLSLDEIRGQGFKGSTKP